MSDAPGGGGRGGRDSVTRAISAARCRQTAAVGAPAMRPNSARNRSKDLRGYDLHRGGRVVACLYWRAHPRQTTGWYLRRRARSARRLMVDTAVDSLACDAISDYESWQERADSVAALSTPFALDAADRALRGNLPRPPSRPLEPGAYELHVSGVDAATLALACPALVAAAAGDTGVLRGILDDAAMCAVIRRVNLLGGRVLAVFRGEPRAAGAAADWTLGSAESRRAGRTPIVPG